MRLLLGIGSLALATTATVGETMRGLKLSSSSPSSFRVFLPCFGWQQGATFPFASSLKHGTSRTCSHSRHSESTKTFSMQAHQSPMPVPAQDRFTRKRQWNGFPVRDTAVLHPHSDIAQAHWASILDPCDTIVDATCGNGYDTLFLARSLLAAGGGTLIACDIQQYAIDKAQSLLEAQLQATITKDSAEAWTCEAEHATGSQTTITILWKTQSHLDLMESYDSDTIKLVVFNLGYLPGGDKSIVTIPEVTLKTIAASQTALEPGGSISITCYPGHEEGVEEEETILTHAHTLPCEKWSCYYHQWINQRNKRTGKPAPSLVMMQKL